MELDIAVLIFIVIIVVIVSEVKNRHNGILIEKLIKLAFF